MTAVAADNNVSLFLFIDRSSDTQRQPTYHERQAMLSEFASGLDPIPAKKMKTHNNAASAQSVAT